MEILRVARHYGQFAPDDEGRFVHDNGVTLGHLPW